MTAASNPSISNPKTETEPRSCRVIFTCVKMKIATLPLVYKGATLFTPKKLGNLQPTPFFRFPADAVFGRQNDDFEQMFFDFMVT
jgi:hypothetical protein